MLKRHVVIIEGESLAGEKETIKILAPTAVAYRVVLEVQDNGSIRADLFFKASPTEAAKLAGMPELIWEELGASCSSQDFDNLVAACTGSDQKNRPEAYKE